MKLAQSFLIGIAVSIALGGGVFFLASARNENTVEEVGGKTSNVSTQGEKQIIALAAKGGFSPSVTVADAGVPSVLNVKTNGTFDCSSVLVIPSLGIKTNLGATAEKRIEIPPQEKGTTISGTCSMGMYHFALKFE